MLTMSQGFATENSSDKVQCRFGYFTLFHFNNKFSIQSGSLSFGGLEKSIPPVPSVAQRHRKGRRRLNTSLTDDYGEVVSKVHQDDEYSKHIDCIDLF